MGLSAGIGGAPIGSTPAGTGTPITLDGPPTDKPEKARFIDPSTKDYVVADGGEYQRMPSVRQRVVLALTTEFGSVQPIPSFGLKTGGVLDDAFIQRQRQRVLSALAHIPNTELKLKKVDVQLVPPAGRVAIRVDYSDLTTGNPDTVTL